MASRNPLPVHLPALLAAQSGAISAAQCQMLGLSRHVVARFVQDGHWRRVGHGLYVTYAGEIAPATLQWLAILAGGPGAALGLGTAATLAAWRRDDELTLVVPHGSRVQAGPWEVVRSRVPFRTVGNPPRTTPERTALDLIRRDPDQAVGILTDVVNSRLTTPRRLLAELEHHSRFPRREFVRQVLGDVGEGALSALEVMWLRDVERAHGLPRGQRQTRSRAGIRDVLYGCWVVELDGRLGHVGQGAFRDMRRDNLHALRGERTLRFGFQDVDQRPCACAAMLAVALRSTGVQVDLRPCRHGCVESEAALEWVA